MPSEGGADRIALSEPLLDGNEEEYLRDCIASGFVSSSGRYVNRFEAEFSRYMDGASAVATASGTAALHVALIAAGIGPGDTVVMPALTFIAPANAVRYVGAYPVFVDTEPGSWQMDLDRVEEFLGSCPRDSVGLIDPKTGRRIAGLLPVHLLGYPSDADRIESIAAGHGLAVVHDVTQSLGALYKGETLGSRLPYACFSFNGNKLITTGGGGMVTTRSTERADFMRHLTTQAKAHPVRYVHDVMGFNYRLSNVAAAVGCAQFERLGEFVEAKRRIASRYEEAFGGIPGVQLMPAAPWAEPAYWLYTILFGQRGDSPPIDEAIEDAEAHGIQVRPLWEPMQLSRVHEGSTFVGSDVSTDLYARALSLPSSVGLSPSAQDRVIEWVTGFSRQRLA